MRRVSMLFVPCLIACGAAQQSKAGRTLPEAPSRVASDLDEEAASATKADETPSSPSEEASNAKLAPTESSGRGSIEDMRAALAALRGKRMSAVRDAAGEALFSFADALAVRAGSSKEAREAVEEIRLQAERLVRSDVTFEGARWSKRALRSVLSGLEALRTPTETAQLTGWVTAAERAVQSIQEDAAITFQRAEVQDAFRTVLDLFVLTTEGTARCQAQQAEPPGGHRAGAGGAP